MSRIGIIGLVILGGIVIESLVSMKEIRRYLRISRM